MRAQIAITRNGITQSSSNKSPPEGGVLARRTNGNFLISLHRHASETALVQMMHSLRALDPGFEMSFEMAGNITRHLSLQDTCLRLVLRALGILEQVNELLSRSNLEINDRKRPPKSMLSQNLLKLAELDLAGKEARKRFSKSAPRQSRIWSRSGKTGPCGCISLLCQRRQTGRRRCRPPASPSTKDSTRRVDNGFPSSMRQPSRYRPRSITTVCQDRWWRAEAIPAICLSGHAAK